MLARGSFVIATLAFHATVLPLSARAQTDYVPSAVTPVPASSSLISRQTAMIAGFLFAGALMADPEVREETQEQRTAATNSIAMAGNSFGTWSILIPALSATYLAGQVAGSGEIKGTVLRAGAAAALATAVTTGLKYTVGRSRPDVGGGNFEFRPFSGAASFPSGHTAAAFAIATAVADQTHDGWSDYVLYGAASLTAISRINDNRHWASDVLIGGLVGHLSAKWIGRKMGPVQVAPTGVSVNLKF
ncbi:MAG TPA: phosphatase PAP2 family protein [Gemmatimonadales bacterium]|jgi:membrane-associated phospholipid phosphatase